jgi:hypothetical protein
MLLLEFCSYFVTRMVVVFSAGGFAVSTILRLKTGDEAIRVSRANGFA